MNESSNYRPDIDGLRAFSIVAVVAYHAFPTLLPGGFVGVDIFFVISGYLITGIILRGTARGDFSLAHFYRRRVQRILPATLLVLAATLLAGWWILLPYEYAALGGHTAAGAGFVPNIVYWTEAGYFDTDSKLKPLLHLWSLGVEEQFYLLWPGLLCLILRWRLHAGAALWLLSTASFIGCLTAADSASAFFLPQNRIWELLMGGALATLPLKESGQGSWRHVASTAGLGLLCCSVVVIHAGADFPGWWTLLPTLGAAAMIAAGERGVANRVMGIAPLIWIGRISFPLYLWHWPLLTFARIMENGEPRADLRATAVTMAVLLAWATYRLVEAPLRYHPSRRVPGLLLAGMLACAGAGLAVWAADGLPHRTADRNELASNLYWKELGLHERDDCSEQFGVPGRCLSSGGTPRIAVLGDSHSTNVFFALQHHYRGGDTGVVRLGRGGCPPLSNVDVREKGSATECLQITADNLQWALDTDSIRTVYLSSMGPMYLRERGRYQLAAAEGGQAASNAELFRAGLTASVGKLLAAGKEVVLVIDWPGLGFEPSTCVDLRPMRLTPFESRECRIPRAKQDRRSRGYRAILLEVAREKPGVMLWDTPAVFCDREFCHGDKNGVLLYRDPAHLSQAGSRYLGEHLKLVGPGQL